MTFCGHCGYLLDPTMSKCPRCGTPVDTSTKTEEGASTLPANYRPPVNQQDIAAITNDDYATSISPSTDPYYSEGNPEQTLPPHMPAGTPYPPQTPPYPNLPENNRYNPYVQPGETSHPGFATSPTIDQAENPYYPTPATPRRKTSPALILAIVALILAIGLATFLLLARPGLLQPVHNPGSTTATPVPTATVAATSTPVPTATVAANTPEQQARTTIEQYFNNINNKNYRTAYNQWATPPDSYQNFVNGFAHTQHDSIQIGAITQQNDGTVKVPIVVNSLTDTGAQQTFSGYYVVGQQPDNSWKITPATSIHKGTA